MPIPASAPTSVPLILMNCRSRPTASSTLRAVSSPSHRSTVSVIVAVSSSRYVVTRYAAASSSQPSTLAAQPVVAGQPAAERGHPRGRPAAQLAVRVRDRLQQGRPHAAGQVTGRRPHGGVGQQTGLELLGPVDRLQVVLEVAPGLGQEPVHRPAQRVLRIALHLARDPDHLAVDAQRHRLVDEPRRPGGRLPGDRVDDHVLVLGEPAVHLVDDELEHALVRPVLDHPGQQPAQRRADRCVQQSRQQGLLEHRAHVVVTEHLDGAAQHGGRLVGHPPRVVRVGQPAAEPGCDPDRAQPVPHHLLGQEVGPDEVAQPGTQLVLAGRDDRRVRDRQARAAAGTGR